MSEKAKGKNASDGFPKFAADFPKHPELDALVLAFADGDYRTVREKALKLAASAEDAEVKRAAETLRERIEPEPTAKFLFAATALLLVILTVWWVTHDGPSAGAPAKPMPTIEIVK